MQLLVNLNKKELVDYLKFTNSFIIGLENYAINYYEASIEEIKELVEKYPIDLFVSINKNIFNKDLEDLKIKLLELSKLRIKGILFYDLSILELTKKLNLKIPLVIHQTHLITNYNICNYYFEHKVSYAYLSSEITKEEIAEISQKTNIKLMVYFIGHQIISYSKRKLISNYYQYIKKEDNKKYHLIKEKNKTKKYIITENKQGTNILMGDILNGTRAYLELKDKISYAILDNQYIDDNLFLKVLELYKKNLDKEISDEDLIDKVKALISDNEGFFFLKTIYKVK